MMRLGSTSLKTQLAVKGDAKLILLFFQIDTIYESIKS